MSYFRADQPSKQLWNKIKNSGAGKESSSNSISLDKNELNSFFARAQASPPVSRYDQTIHEHDNAFNFSLITKEAFLHAFASIKSNAAGDDGIRLKFLKLIISVFADHIIHLFNSIIASNIWPNGWKTSVICPIPKCNAPTLPSDFRPIGILPILSKTLELLLNGQIQTYLLSIYQSGFRKNCGTATALAKVTDDIRSSLDRGQVSVLVFLDFSKAFDNVDHHILLSKLKSQFKFSARTCDLLHSCLSARTIKVKIDNDISEERPVSSGVVQGSILGPTLFLFYIQDLFAVIKSCNYQCYADDVQIYCSAHPKDIAVLISCINNDLKSVFDWSIKNKIYLNNAKSSAMFFSNNHKDIPKPVILINEQPVEYTAKKNNLGVIMNDRLTWDDHIVLICQKVYFGLKNLSSVNGLVPLDLRLKLVRALIIPHFTYADILFSNTGASQTNKLDLCFNACLRYIYKRKKFDHILDVRRNLLGCDLGTYYKFRLIMSLFKIIRIERPAYLYNQLVFASSQRTCNLIIPRAYSNRMLLSVSCRAALAWNSLPNWMKSETQIGRFKSLLRTFPNFDP